MSKFPLEQLQFFTEIVFGVRWTLKPIHWIAIYPVDNVIKLSNNCGLKFYCYGNEKPPSLRFLKGSKKSISRMKN